MSDGYGADLPAMRAATDRLVAAGGELRAAVTLLDEGAGGELGPEGITAAVDALTDGWARRLRSVEAEQDALIADVMAAVDAYVEADRSAADGFGGLLDSGDTG